MVWCFLFRKSTYVDDEAQEVVDFDVLMAEDFGDGEDDTPKLVPISPSKKPSAQRKSDELLSKGMHIVYCFMYIKTKSLSFSIR